MYGGGYGGGQPQGHSQAPQGAPQGQQQGYDALARAIGVLQQQPQLQPNQPQGQQQQQPWGGPGGQQQQVQPQQRAMTQPSMQQAPPGPDGVSGSLSSMAASAGMSPEAMQALYQVGDARACAPAAPRHAAPQPPRAWRDLDQLPLCARLCDLPAANWWRLPMHDECPSTTPAIRDAVGHAAALR
jgi:hypothetical protein